MGLRLVRREEWGATKPRATVLLDVPVSMVFICYTHSTLCKDGDQCVDVCRRIQRQDLANSMGDLRYSFLVGGDGRVYEGRGWTTVPKLTRRYISDEHRSIFIGCIAKNTSACKELLYQALQELISFGIENNYIRKDFKERFI